MFRYLYGGTMHHHLSNIKSLQYIYNTLIYITLLHMLETIFIPMYVEYISTIFSSSYLTVLFENVFANMQKY